MALSKEEYRSKAIKVTLLGSVGSYRDPETQELKSSFQSNGFMKVHFADGTDLIALNPLDLLGPANIHDEFEQRAALYLELEQVPPTSDFSLVNSLSRLD